MVDLPPRETYDTSLHKAWWQLKNGEWAHWEDLYGNEKLRDQLGPLDRAAFELGALRVKLPW